MTLPGGRPFSTGIVALALAPMAAGFSPEACPKDQAGSPSAAAAEWPLVTRVVDGDTIVLDGDERVRLIGVDTPETVHPQKPVEHFGKQASAFIRRLLEGRRVRLAFDQQRRDRYGRTLAYVYLPDGSRERRDHTRPAPSASSRRTGDLNWHILGRYVGGPGATARTATSTSKSGST